MSFIRKKRLDHLVINSAAKLAETVGLSQETFHDFDAKPPTLWESHAHCTHQRGRLARV